MASPSQRSHHSDSPHTTVASGSSSDCSPQTVLTAFSPNDPLTKAIHSQSQDNLSDISNKDPFISYDDKLKIQPKLCPTASVFQPIRMKTGVSMPVIADGSGSPLRASSVHTKQLMLLDQISSPGKSSSPEKSPLTQDGVFTTNTSFTRCFKVMEAYTRLTIDELERIIDSAQRQIKLHGAYRTAAVGCAVFVRFTCLSDATSVFSQIKNDYSYCGIEYVTPNTFIQAIMPGHTLVSSHEGQVLMTCRLPTNSTFHRGTLEDSLQDLLMMEGDVVAYQRQLAASANKFTVVVEFDNSNCATTAVKRLNNVQVRGVDISCVLHQPDVEPSSPVMSRGVLPVVPVTPARRTGSINDIVNPMSAMSMISPYAPMLSPTGRSYVHTPSTMSPIYANLLAKYGQPPVVPFENHLVTPPGAFTPEWTDPLSPASPLSRGMSSPQAHPPSRRQYTPRSKTFSPSSHHNTVDINRIRNGSDVRTTIMLRNIPNKVTQVMLKEIVDQTSFGLYDFMYLRIDFANNCNVGYAFINFEDPYNIIDFVNSRAGKKWNHFNSDKVAEVSYATIQGKDCLVQKFRNSSVMLEHQAFRPKIFFTGSHPMAGQEDKFPPPDNPSKMRRSVENAEHVGLFAPRSGQHFHDEQRRRRSRFDRGTRFAEFEEGDYQFDDGIQLEQPFDEATAY